MFPDAKLKPLPAEESYALVGKEAQHFFSNKVYTPARRGDKFRELVKETFENVRSTICVGWDAQNKPTHFLPMSTVLAGRPIDFQVEDPSPAQAPAGMDAATQVYQVYEEYVTPLVSDKRNINAVPDAIIAHLQVVRRATEMS